MMNYNFNILQPAEFEELIRDLVQEHIGTFVESFTSGRDSGIDLRFATVNGGKTIVQAKRYKDYASLLSNLKGEVAKVRRINPESYMVATSVGLTPKNKDEIKDLFTPYIQDTTQIWGADDLNNLIGLYKDIEKKHYKLWLASTNVLQSIINKNVVNWSNFELEQIKQNIKTYVLNESFYSAKNILQKYNYVIISGIPGIGKTTLANILVYDCLANGYDEFVNIPGDMDNASKLYDPNKKQVFFFDDFLGANIFEHNGSGFAQKLLSFISVVKKDSTKKFILTTREYILSDAYLHYEKLRNENLELAKCVLDIGSYTKIVRAKILYNHIANAFLPQEYIREFLRGKGYKWIISHQNFNPRVIEIYIDKQQWLNVPVSDFMNRFREFFSNPYMVWEMAYNNLTPESQYALMILASMGGEVLMESWNKAFCFFCSTVSSKTQLRTDDFTWSRVVKILHDCFIKTMKFNNKILVGFYNPSVKDFIVNHIRKYENTQRLLLEGALYPEQLTSLYDEFSALNTHEIFRYNNITLSDSNTELLTNKFLEFLNSTPESCKITKFSNGGYVIERYSQTYFVRIFSDKFPKLFKKIQNQIFSIILNLVMTSDYTNFYNRIQLVKHTDWTNKQFVLKEVLMKLLKDDKDAEDYIELLELLHDTGNIDLVNEPSMVEKIKVDIMADIDAGINSYADYVEYEELCLDIERRLPDGVEISNVFTRLQEIKETLEDVPDEDNEDFYKEYEYSYREEDDNIDKLMNSLLQ